MKVLVTGSRGRVGRLLVRKLVDLGHYEVVGVARGPGRDAVRTITVDLSRLDQVAEVVAMESADVVFHLAALTGGQSEPSTLRHINVDLVGTLAREAWASGVKRFVFASSSAVYGDRYSAPISEQGPLDPLSPYAETKVEAEHVLRDLATADGSTVALRIFNIYGEGFDDSLVNRLEQSSPSNPVTLRGWDSFVRDYVHVLDVVDSMVAAMEQPLPTSFSAINVGSGAPTSNGQLVGVIGRDQPVHYDLVPAGPSYSCADIGLARNLLGVSPRLLDPTCG